MAGFLSMMGQGAMAGVRVGNARARTKEEIERIQADEAREQRKMLLQEALTRSQQSENEAQAEYYRKRPTEPAPRAPVMGSPEYFDAYRRRKEIDQEFNPVEDEDAEFDEETQRQIRRRRAMMEAGVTNPPAPRRDPNEPSPSQERSRARGLALDRIDNMVATGEPRDRVISAMGTYPELRGAWTPDDVITAERAYREKQERAGPSNAAVGRAAERLGY